MSLVSSWGLKVSPFLDKKKKDKKKKSSWLVAPDPSLYIEERLEIQAKAGRRHRERLGYVERSLWGMGNEQRP